MISRLTTRPDLIGFSRSDARLKNGIRVSSNPSDHRFQTLLAPRPLWAASSGRFFMRGEQSFSPSEPRFTNGYRGQKAIETRQEESAWPSRTARRNKRSDGVPSLIPSFLQGEKGEEGDMRLKDCFGLMHWTNDHRDWYRNIYLRSDHWTQLRAAKLARDPACQVCSATSSLDVHHVIYRNIFDVRLTDLLTVCRRCHQGIHERNGNPVRQRPDFNQLTKREVRAIEARNAMLPQNLRRKLHPSRPRRRKRGTATKSRWESTRIPQ